MRRNIRVVLVLLATIAAVALVGCSSSTSSSSSGGGSSAGGTSPAGGSAVSIQNFSFAPASITVKVGDTVTWTNNDSTTHTVTGTDFDSGPIDSGATYSHAFAAAGSFDYHCSIHPNMKGTVVVQ